MQRHYRFLPAVFGLFAFALPVYAAETIPSFNVNATLSENRNLQVTESIRYDFGDAERHGIYRRIPERYSRNGGAYNLRLSIGDSTMDEKSVDQSVSREGDDRVIRLGNADRTITGAHTYAITYGTTRAINDFPEDHERELYWNVTGNGWEVPIAATSFHIELPAPATRLVCYTGVFGSTEQACKITSSGNIVTAVATRPLESGEGLTIAIRIPEDSVRGLSLYEEITSFISDNLWVFTPIIVFLLMFYVWRRYGKDPAGRGTIIAEYTEPDQLPPALQASLVDQNVPARAITATLLDLARRGYAKVRFDGDPSKDGWFSKSKIYYEKVKDADENLLPYEAKLLNGVFAKGDSVDLSKRNDKFWTDLQAARIQIFDELKKRGLFNMNPSTLRFIWIAVAVGAVFIGFYGVAIFGELFIVSGILSAIIIAGFGWQMPSATKAGAVMVERVLGFKKFLSVTEQARLDFTDAPERKPEQFARFLPAAVAFGVEEKWAEHFANIQLPQPPYMSGNMNTWNAVSYAHAMQSFHSQSATAMYTAPSSAGHGGSGFSGGGSGGGFGGGGGGSW